MFDALCALPLSADLFAHAVHPSEPIIAIGLASGHVSALKLPAVDDDSEPSTIATQSLNKQHRGRRGSLGTDVIEVAWRTKRHQESCRALAFSLDGRQLYSGGADGIVKAADAETGRVTGKLAIPLNLSSASEPIDAPTVLHALSPQTLILATDSGALHLYDLRDPAPSVPIQDNKQAFIGGKPVQTHHPHTDYVSSLTPIPPSATSTSGFSKQWLTTGGTTLALTDLRRGVLVKSEDQEEILLSSLYVDGLPARKSSGSSGEKALVGGGDGVITLWEKGQYDDQDERIVVSREKETVDCLAELPVGIGGFGKKIAAGLGDGKVKFVRMGMNKVVGEVTHHDIEGVTALAFDVCGRMITGGGDILKVWKEAIGNCKAVDSDDDDQDDGTNKRSADSDDEDEDGPESESDSDDDESAQRAPQRKKRKRGKGSAPLTNFTFAGLD